MKKMALAMAAGLMIFILSSCGQKKDLDENQTYIMNSNADKVQEMQNNGIVNADHTDLPEEPEKERQSIPDEVFDTKESLDSQKEESSDGQIKIDDELEVLAGEYEYQSDYGTGKLIIEKTAYGYDISDYESESAYRFLADSSNIDVIKNNRIYIKYPEQAFSDDTVIWSYYILEYSTDGINVYYTKSADEEGQLLYHAARKSEEGQSKTNDVKNDLYEGEYCDYEVNEPSLQIKKNEDGTYQIQIYIVRTWNFDDIVGTMTEDGLEFTATGAGEKEVNGTIKIKKDIATVTILGEPQAWLDYKSEFIFYKTSDVPHIAEYRY